MLMFWLPVGLLLPTLSGWLVLGLLEGSSPVLLRAERWALGLLLGLTLTMFTTFLVYTAGCILFTRWGFLVVQIALTALLVAARLWQRRHLPALRPSPPLPASDRLPRWLSAALCIALLWTAAKIAFGGYILMATPPVFDDTLKNWNLRGKIFYETSVLDVPVRAGEESNTLSAYPPFVSLAKTGFATLAGEWNEPLVNSIHVIWFLVLLVLLYAALRRHLSQAWSLCGVMLLASLPLELFQGVNAYADVFLSAHLFAAVTLTVQGIREPDTGRRHAFFRLAALATALLTVTKNEALLLYLPLLCALLAAGLFSLRRTAGVSGRERVLVLLWFAVWLCAITAPWVVFKWMHGLAFGNAKALSTGYEIGWQPNVLQTLWINVFFEGNWHLLFPLFFGLLALRWRTVFRGPAALLTWFVLCALLLQTGLFLFTSLSVEALNQTGVARGIIQIVPLIVLVTVPLLKEGLRREN